MALGKLGKLGALREQARQETKPFALGTEETPAPDKGVDFEASFEAQQLDDGGGGEEQVQAQSMGLFNIEEEPEEEGPISIVGVETSGFAQQFSFMEEEEEEQKHVSFPEEPEPEQVRGLFGMAVEEEPEETAVEEQQVASRPLFSIDEEEEEVQEEEPEPEQEEVVEEEPLRPLFELDEEEEEEESTPELEPEPEPEPVSQTTKKTEPKKEKKQISTNSIKKSLNINTGDKQFKFLDSMELKSLKYKDIDDNIKGKECNMNETDRRILLQMLENTEPNFGGLEFLGEEYLQGLWENTKIAIGNLDLEG